jgi:hypothetical protein
MKLRKSKHVMKVDNVALMDSVLGKQDLPLGVGDFCRLVAVVMDQVAHGEDSFLTVGGTRKRDAILVTVQMDGERASEGMGGLEELEQVLKALLSS